MQGWSFSALSHARVSEKGLRLTMRIFILLTLVQRSGACCTARGERFGLCVRGCDGGAGACNFSADFASKAGCTAGRRDALGANNSCPGGFERAICACSSHCPQQPTTSPTTAVPTANGSFACANGLCPQQPSTSPTSAVPAASGSVACANSLCTHGKQLRQPDARDGGVCHRRGQLALVVLQGPREYRRQVPECRVRQEGPPVGPPKLPLPLRDGVPLARASQLLWHFDYVHPLRASDVSAYVLRNPCRMRAFYRYSRQPDAPFFDNDWMLYTSDPAYRQQHVDASLARGRARRPAHSGRDERRHTHGRGGSEGVNSRASK